jgi:sugar phosphate isomerase/epimerase
VSLIQELGDRVVAVHVKDGPMTGNISTAQIPQDQTPAGQGDVPIAEVLAAAPALEYAVIEFDHSELDVFDAVEQSYRWLAATLDKEAVSA